MTWELNQAAIRGDFLMHHGVRGQRRGRRRYQNEDGSLTPEGREHYGVGEKQLNRLGKQFGHEVKRLQKLDDKANVKKQNLRYLEKSSAAKRSAAIGTGIASAALGVEIGKPFGTKYSQRSFRSKNPWGGTSKTTIGTTYNIDRIFSLLSGATAVGFYANAAKNGIQSGIAKHRTTEKSHAKAVSKRKEQYQKMQSIFKDTPYADLLKKENARIEKNR